MTARSRLNRTLIAFAAVVGLAAILWQIRRAPETYPYADTATTSIYTLRAVKGELATGAYSRFQWHHPGPLLYEMLAPLYALSGRREVSLKWSMLLVNIAVLAGLLTYLGRHSRWLCATTAIAALPLIYFEERLLFWAWNPVAPLLSLALAMALTAGVCAGDIAALPWLAGVVSFLVQSHVGFAPVSLLLTSAAVVAVLWRMRRGDDGHAVKRAVLASAIVGAVLWSVPVVHDLRSGTSNFAGIARSLATRDVRPWAQVRDIVANELVATFSPSRELITGDLPESAVTSVRIWAVVQLVLLAVVAVWARRRGRPFDSAFAWLCIASSIIGVFGVRSIAGDIFDYLVIWIGIIGMLNVAALLSAISLLFPRPPAASRPPLDVRWRAAMVVWLTAVAALGITRLNWKQRADSGDRTVAHLADDLARYCDEHHYVRPLFTFDWRVWQPAAGIVLQLYKEDRAVAVADDARFMFGEPFARTGSEPAALHLMSVDDEAMPAGVTRFTWIASIGGYRLIQVWRD